MTVSHWIDRRCLDERATRFGCKEARLTNLAIAVGRVGLGLKGLAGLNSNYAALLSASILRNQISNGFQPAKEWSTISKSLILND